MNTILILHGVTGHAGIHWMQWLHDNVVSDHKVIMPSLPNTENPSKSDWLDFITEILKDVDHDSLVIVGHSLGVPVALQYVQDSGKKIKGLISVAGFHKDYGSEINTKFMKDTNIDLSKVKDLIENKAVIYGDDDPYVPQELLRELPTGLKVEPTIIKNGGHINTRSGYTELPILIEIINNFPNH